MPPFYRQVMECCVKIKSFIQGEHTTINELFIKSNNMAQLISIY